MAISQKRLSRILLAVPVILTFPFVGNFISDEVNWSLSDFLIMGLLLTLTGIGIELVLSKFACRRSRITLVGGILLLLLLTWAELAVGIFGTPFAGN